MSEPLIKFYAVRNKEGKFFRAKGYCGTGDTWVDDIKKAKIYAKSNGARGVITWFYNNYPQFGIPELVELCVNEMNILKEEKRVVKSNKNKKIKDIKRQIKDMEYRIKNKIRYGDDSREKIDSLKKELEELDQKVYLVSKNK